MKVEFITGKPTVSRIYQKLEMDKENYKGGRLSMLSPTFYKSVFTVLLELRMGLNSVSPWTTERLVGCCKSLRDAGPESLVGVME